MSHDIKSAERPAPDHILTAIADYALSYEITNKLAYETAGYCLMDTLACGFQALKYPACTKLMGPVVPGATLTNGARVPGTAYELDPINAAFNIGAMIRWLDFNDTWLAAEWGHPSDNLGGILAVADYLSRSGQRVSVRDVLTGMIKAHEIQGVLALENSFNRVGLDHVLLVRVASTAVVTALLGGSREQIINAVSNAWVDGGALQERAAIDASMAILVIEIEHALVDFGLGQWFGVSLFSFHGSPPLPYSIPPAIMSKRDLSSSTVGTLSASSSGNSRASSALSNSSRCKSAAE